MTQLTPKKVNKFLMKSGIEGEIVRNSKGYYYFDGELFDIVPSIYQNNLSGWTFEMMINYIKENLKKYYL